MTKLYTTEEVADILKYDVQTIRRFIREEKIPAYKVGKEYRIEEKDFRNYLEKGSEQVSSIINDQAEREEERGNTTSNRHQKV